MYCKGYNIQYMNCINRNFTIAERRLNVRIDNCTNWNGGRTNYPYKLSRDFQNCVNRNFRQIDFLLRRRP